MAVCLKDFLNKKYVLKHSGRQWDELLKQLGASLFYRKIAGVIKPTIELRKEKEDPTDNRYVFTKKSSYRNDVVTFTPDVPVECRTMDGRNVRTVFKVDGSCLWEVQTDHRTGARLKIRWSFYQSKVLTTVFYRHMMASQVYRVIGSKRGYLTGVYERDKHLLVQSDSD